MDENYVTAINERLYAFRRSLSRGQRLVSIAEVGLLLEIDLPALLDENERLRERITALEARDAGTGTGTGTGTA